VVSLADWTTALRHPLDRSAPHPLKMSTFCERLEKSLVFLRLGASCSIVLPHWYLVHRNTPHGSPSPFYCLVGYRMEYLLFFLGQLFKYWLPWIRIETYHVAGLLIILLQC